MEGPLEGIRVLAVEQYLAGPYGTMMLADMGAEVIKIERPGTGDGMRLKVFPVGEGGAGGQFLLWNRNKKSLTLDLQKERGKDIFKRLVEVSDVVWENFRPGTMERLGLGYSVLRQINPRLVYASVSGFGHDDIYPNPLGQRPAFDIIPQAMSGLISVAAGDGPPHWLGFPVGDQFASVLAAHGVVLALLARQRTGLGQHVDIAMYDGLVMLNERAIGLYALTGETATQSYDPFVSPQGVFKTKDGYVAIAPQSEPTWVRFCQALHREDLIHHPQLSDPADRSRHFQRLLNPIVEEWAKDKTRDEVVELLLQHEVPVGPVQMPEDILDCPQVRARRMLVGFADPRAGKVKTVGSPVKLSGMEEQPPSPPPLLGQHTQDLLQSLLGLRAAEVAALRSEGVI